MAIRRVDVKLTDTSPSSATTTASASEGKNVEAFDLYVIQANLTGATGGTLDVYIQDFCELTSQWVDWVHFSQLAAAASATYKILVPALVNTETTVGVGTSPALAAGTCRGGPPRSKIRLLFVAGASTSAGASQTVVVSCFSTRT